MKEQRAQPSVPSPLTDSCNLLGKISFFSAQEKILVVPITRKTKPSAGHQRLPEAETMSRALSGAAKQGGWGGRERTLVQAYPAGGGGGDRSRNLEKRSPPQNLEVWAVE